MLLYVSLLRRLPAGGSLSERGVHGAGGLLGVDAVVAAASDWMEL